jgi:hypothetical protein
MKIILTEKNRILFQTEFFKFQIQIFLFCHQFLKSGILNCTADNFYENENQIVKK